MRQSSRALASTADRQSGETAFGDWVPIERLSRFESGPERPPPFVEHRDQQVDDEPGHAEPAAADGDPASGQAHPAGTATILDLRRVEPCSLAKAHRPILPRVRPVPNLESGADGARTRDLRAASATLSQLSYGPLPPGL